MLANQEQKYVYIRC